MLAFVLTSAACVRPAPPSPEVPRNEVLAQIDLYRRAALEPARVAPPSIEIKPVEIQVGPIHGVARPLRAEDADWNQWPGGGPRLFNNRAAQLVHVRIEAGSAAAWLPEGTTLELNDEHTVLAAAGTTEALLGDLLYWAFMEERWLADGDLVDRARGAGPFRSAYLPLHNDEGVLEGVVAFPLLGAEGTSLAELHVVAVRLTVRVLAEDGPVDLVWVIE